MPKTRFSLIILFFTFSFQIFAQNLPKKQEIIAKMALVNGYLVKKYKSPPKNDMNTAIYFEGLNTLNKLKPDKINGLFIANWAKKNKYQLPENGSYSNAEDLAIATTYIDLYKTDTTKKEIIKATKARIDSLVDSYKLDEWSRLEALYGLMPNLAKMAVLYKDERYHDKMFQVFMYVKNVEGLYSDQEFLWFRDASFKPPFKTPNRQNCYWSRANGLLAVGLTKVLETLPKDAPHYSEYMDSYLEMMIATMNLQRPDGFWNVSLTDPNHFGGKELTGTALITYAMAWGLSNNIIDKTTFTPIVTKAINAMLKDCVNKNGFLGWVQGNAIEPKEGQPLSATKAPENEYLGVGCFLLACGEVAKL